LNNKISEKDKKDWEEFLSGKEKLHNKDATNFKKNKSRIKTIDLHGYSLEKANKLIEVLIYDSYEKNIKKLKVVTGKGLHSNNEKDPFISKDLGILKYSVPDFIQNNSELMKKIFEIKDASPEDGGSGAFYIILKRK